MNAYGPLGVWDSIFLHKLFMPTKGILNKSLQRHINAYINYAKQMNTKL